MNRVYEEDLDAVYDDLWKAQSTVWKSSLISLLLGFAFGWLMFSEPHTDVIETPTVEQVIQSLPPDVKRDIAIDYCASGTAAHRMCASLPMQSPVGPMDGGLK